MTNVPEIFQPGYESALGSYHFKPDEIIRFALKFDPQPFHIDELEAKKSLFGDLCASGWQTISVWQKLNRKFQSKTAEEFEKSGMSPPIWGPSPGMKDVKWLRPVFAGETISYFNRNESIRKSKSNPGWWLLESHHEGAGEDGKPVISFTSTAFVRFTD